MTDLKVFDSLAADITLFVAPVKTLKVTDPVSSQAAIDAAKSIKDYLSRVEKKRKELTEPLKAQAKSIEDYCHQITAPLLEVQLYVKSQIDAFAAEQLRLARLEEARIERERRKAEDRAREDRERHEAELIAKQKAEAEAHAGAEDLFGADEETETARLELEAKQERERAEHKAEQDRIAAIQANEFRQKQWDADQVKIKNTRAKLKARVIDINLVPKEYLIIEPNMKALEAVGKAGVKVPGVEFYEEVTVAIGEKTRMPKIS